MEDNSENIDGINFDDIQSVLNENQSLQNKNTSLVSDMSTMALTNKHDGNIAHYLIQTQELLDRLEHFYRGEYISTEGKKRIWKKPDDPDQIPFNSFGVSALMEIVSKYIDRNTSLSYYKEERIFEILGDLGDELITFIISNYEKMGMDTHFKKTKFRLIVVTTLHIIESTYRRAIGGKTLEEINQSRIITQSDILGRNNMQMQPQPKKRGFWPWSR